VNVRVSARGRVLSEAVAGAREVSSASLGYVWRVDSRGRAIFAALLETDNAGRRNA
jgi:hypothetical protein